MNIREQLTTPFCISNPNSIVEFGAIQDYFLFTFYKKDNNNYEKLIDWLNKIPRHNFYVVESEYSFKIFLAKPDALAAKLIWG
jgi:hypothetical protein